MNERQLLSHLKLHLAIQQPDLESCYMEGYDAFNIHNEQSEQNPYPAFSKENEYWNEGWWAACCSEEPLFNEEYETIQEPIPLKTAANQPITNKKKANSFFHSYGLRVFEILASIAVAIVGYQLADFAFI